MSKKANPVAVGLFVITALLLAVGAFVAAGVGDAFKEKHYAVLHFSDPIGGLDIGAPVEFKGVRVGAVTDIRLVYDPQKRSSRAPVVVQLEPDQWDLERGKKCDDLAGQINLMIADGMRGQLQMQSLLTGKLKIVLKMAPDRLGEVMGGNLEHVEIPTVPTSLSQVKEEFDELPIEDIIRDAHRLIQSLADIAGSDDITKVVGSLRSTLGDLSEAAATLEEQIEPMAGQVSDVSSSLQETLRISRLTLQSIDTNVTALATSLTRTADQAGSVLGADSSLRVQAQEALGEVTAAARSLRTLTDYLERHPESLLRGKQGAE
jgi:paraquat-inducible protein B